MYGTNQTFTIQGAHQLIGRAVKLTRACHGRFEGETGTITGAMEYRDGYAVEVTWNIRFGSGRLRTDSFTASEYQNFLREI